MNRNTRLQILAAVGVSMLPACVANAGQVVWPEGEEPNILVQWWINTARNSLAFWPTVITLCVVLMGIMGFFFRFRQYRRQMAKMKDKENALTTT